MPSFNINKGIGSTVEFQGLKAQYLFIFAGGLLGILILVMVMYMAGLNNYVCIITGSAGGAFTVWKTFAMNKKYGRYGLMKEGAKKRHPKYIINRKAARRFIKIPTPKN